MTKKLIAFSRDLSSRWRQIHFPIWSRDCRRICVEVLAVYVSTLEQVLASLRRVLAAVAIDVRFFPSPLFYPLCL